eukprot:1854478-Prorocentrum_lima.AAC.1
MGKEGAATHEPEFAASVANELAKLNVQADPQALLQAIQNAGITLGKGEKPADGNPEKRPRQV